MKATEPINNTLRHHHFYVKQYGPAIKEHLDRVAGKHGDRFPWMAEVAADYTAIYEDLILHMQKRRDHAFPKD